MANAPTKKAPEKSVTTSKNTTSQTTKNTKTKATTVKSLPKKATVTAKKIQPTTKVANVTVAKKAKVQKVKMKRDSFTMPKNEYDQLAILKEKLTTLGQSVKKSELLRAGLKILATMSDNALKAALSKLK